MKNNEWNLDHHNGYRVDFKKKIVTVWCGNWREGGDKDFKFEEVGSSTYFSSWLSDACVYAGKHFEYQQHLDKIIALIKPVVSEPILLEKKERILCAAIWVDDGVERVHLPRNIKTGLVFSGWRHSNCFVQIEQAFPKGSVDEEEIAGKHQGFITSLGRFVSRDEAGTLAFEAGQVDKPNMFLTSEDLY